MVVGKWLQLTLVGETVAYNPYLYLRYKYMTTLWEVAESQQNINTQPQQIAEQVVEKKVEVQPTQSVEQTNLTWTSSWVEQTQVAPQVQQQVVVEQPTLPQTPSPEELMRQIQWVVEENKTLEEVAQENDTSRIQKENEDALKSLVEETTKDIPTAPVDVSQQVQAQISDTSETDKLAEDIKESIEDMKTVNQAKDIAKKCYNALLKEKQLHEMDNKSNKELIDYLQWIINQQKKDSLSRETDPRVVKLDDEAYTMWKLEEAYKKDKSSANQQNLNRLYLTKLAINNPWFRVNDLVNFMNWTRNKSNVMGDAAPSSAPVAEVRKANPIPMGIPRSMRGML